MSDNAVQNVRVTLRDKMVFIRQRNFDEEDSILMLHVDQISLLIKHLEKCIPEEER